MTSAAVASSPSTTPDDRDEPLPPFGTDVVRLRTFGVVRTSFDSGPHFCLRVGEDALRTCTGGPALPIEGQLPEFEWSFADDVVSIRSGLFELTVDSWTVSDVDVVEIPDAVADLAIARDYTTLIAEYSDYVATPEVKWLAPELLSQLPPGRVVILPSEPATPVERSGPEIEEFEQRLRVAIEQRLPGRYIEISTASGNDGTTSPTVVIVPHSADQYRDAIDAARRDASTSGVPEVIVLSMAERLD